MKFSHSKLKLFFNCPMTYHLKYDLGITPKNKAQALTDGEAVHWGLEHNTSDLEDFYKENQNLKNFKNKDNQILEEVMVDAFLKNKKEIFDKILTDEKGNKLELLEEIHELELTVPLNKNPYIDEVNEFTGIIDLLLLTNKGFIIVDYKTSSTKPDFNKYLSQLYKYIYLCKKEFSEVPVYRIAIINLQKSKTKRKSTQTELQYQKQLEKEYVIAEDNDDLIRLNIFDRDIISDEEINKAILDLEDQCNYVTIVSNALKYTNAYYTNWEFAKQYGGSPYMDLLEKRDCCELLYNVKDKYIINGKIVDSRPMRHIDFLAIDEPIYLKVCRYKNYKKLLENYEVEEYNELIDGLKENIDEELLKVYETIYEKECKDKSK